MLEDSDNTERYKNTKGVCFNFNKWVMKLMN